MIDEHLIMLESAKYANKFLVEEPNIRAIFRTAFYDGAKWADEHPKSIWHDSSEEPQGENWLLLFEGEKGNYWVQSKDGVIFFHNTWKEYVRAEMVSRWAYIDELIKK